MEPNDHYLVITVIAVGNCSFVDGSTPSPHHGFSPTAVYRTLTPPPPTTAHSVTALYRPPTDLFYFKTAALGNAEELLIRAVNIKGFKETFFRRNPDSFARQT